MSDIPETVEMTVEEVGDMLNSTVQGVEEFRGFDKVRLAYLGIGLVAGAAIGGFVAFKMAYRKAELEYAEITAEEIAGMRQHYDAKATAQAMSVAKGDLADLVKDKGYSVESEPPIGMAPPSSVIDRAKEAQIEAEDEAAGEPTEPDDEAPGAENASDPEVRNAFRDLAIKDAWDYHTEKKRRSPVRPYVIHVDEREEQQAYDGVTWIYYEADDVLCNERDEVVDMPDRERVIGESNLNKFGHGSNNSEIVYIRNDQLEMDVEIVRTEGSYAEEVHGLDPSEPELRHSHRRMRRSFDDE